MHRFVPVAAAVAVWLTPAVLRAQVVTDGSLGPAQSLAGPDISVPAGLGKQVGGNLFHSFSRLDVAAGEAVTFLGPTSVSQVLTRVTGGEPTSINGILRCTIPGADFYLINRAGVVFGPTAIVDVAGSFAVTTADFVRLADGTSFAAIANPAQDAVLTSAAPVAFGFLGEPTGLINFDGARIGSAQAKSLVFVGGELRLTGALLLNNGGKIELAAIRSAGELSVDVDNLAVALDASVFETLGPVSLAFSTVGGDNVPGGRITVESAGLFLSFSNVRADNFTSVAGLPIDLRARDTITITDGSSVNASSFSSGRSADITLDAGAISIDGGSNVFTSAFNASGGAGGDVTLVAGGTLRVNGPMVNGQQVISSVQTSTSASAPGGTLTIRADDIELLNDARIISTTFSAGAGGDIDITADTLHLDRGTDGAGNCGVFAEAGVGSTGPGGNMRLSVRELRVDDGLIQAATFAAGPTGNIDIDSHTVDLGGRQQLALIRTQTTTAAAAGTVHVRATGPVTLRAGGQIGSSATSTGAGGDMTLEAVSVTADALNAGVFTGLFTESLAPTGGDAGAVRVSADTIRFVNGAQIATFAEGSGNGGAIDVSATTSIAFEQGVQSFTGIFSGTRKKTLPAGKSGDITVRTPSLRLLNGEIAIRGDGEGDTGSITVVAGDVLMRDDPIAGRNAVTRGSITNTANGAAFPGGVGGAGGNIRVTADTLILIDGAFIVTESFTNQRSGDIFITAGRVSLSAPAVTDDASLPFAVSFRLPDGTKARLPLANTTEIGTTSALGPAGNITIQARELSIENNCYVSANTAGFGPGGDVTIRADNVRIAAAGSRFATGVFAASLLPSSGPGGDITIDADRIDVVDGGIIAADTFSSSGGGSVTLAAGRVSLVGNPAAPTPTGVSVQSQGATSGPGGNLNIQASELLEIRNRAFVVAATFGAGNGGAITLGAPEIHIDAGFIASSSDSSGDAGPVTVTTPGRLSLSSGSVISAGATGSGAGNSVTLNVSRLTLDDDASVVATSDGVGLAGNVVVRASDRIDLRNGAEISTSAEQTSGGNIDIQAVNVLSLEDSRVAASAGQDGGNVKIDPEFVLLNRSQLAANAERGNGGNMDIVAGVFLQSMDSTIDVSSRFGLAGTVTITAPEVDVAGALAVLTGGLAQAEANLRDVCGVRTDGVFSSFVVTSRGGAPVAPDSFSPSFSIHIPRPKLAVSNGDHAHGVVD